MQTDSLKDMESIINICLHFVKHGKGLCVNYFRKKQGILM